MHGTDVCIDGKPEDFLPEGTHCTCGSSNLRKETDIFDVWFERGSSFRAVCMARPELSFPSDVYLEGTDQHRGWFQLSLLPSMAAYGEKPFRTVVTHGFIVDEWGQKLSKSKKKESKYDVTAAADCVKVFGADVVRLWIASVDYKEDVLFSEEVVRRLNASYFAIRNCFRFMLGNLDGFRVENALPLEHMPPVDRWALAMLAKTETACRRHYEDFEFHRLFQEFKNFCDVTLSSDYFDILKDRLYCDPVDSLSRRSATTVLYTLARSMAVMISPVLVHTCEEIWDELRTMGETLDSVHLAEWPVFDESVYDSTLPQVFGRLMAVRYAARRRLELLRAENTVRRTEEARVELYTSDLELGMLIAGMQDTLADLFKVSEVELLDAPASGMTEDEDIKGLLVKALKVEHGKCARCWCHRPEVGSIEQHPELCSRCAEAVK